MHQTILTEGVGKGPAGLILLSYSFSLIVFEQSDSFSGGDSHLLLGDTAFDQS